MSCSYIVTDSMLVRKALKFRLKTNSEIEQKLWQFAGACRFLWNYFWRLNHARLSQGHRILRYGEMDYWSKWLKQSEEYRFLAQAPAHILQQKLRDLDRAYSDAFDRNQPNKRLPKQRKRSLHSSFRFPEPKQIQVEGRRIKLPKLGWLHFHKSQDISGEIKNVTVSYKAGHWYLSIQVEQELGIQPAVTDRTVGIDMGVANWAAVSDGKHDYLIEPTNSLQQSQDKLAKAQRKLSRQIKFSQNWRRQKTKLQQIHHHIANVRRNALHHITTDICKNHARIIIEDLKVSNMTRSAKGTQDKPGRCVKAKSGLNRAILDQAWHEFRRQLTYKADWYGAELISIDPKHTSQRCSSCGHTAKGNRMTQAEFACETCGMAMHADINAARNIRAAGLSRAGL